MPRIYIAGPMTGIPEFNFPAFDKAAQAWREAGWDVCNPADHFNRDTTLQYKDYVARDMEELKKCHAIAMLDGWDGPNARGSVWERQVAISLLDIPVWEGEGTVEPPTHVRNPNADES